MILGTEQLLWMVNDPDIMLVTDLSERERKNPEGAGFDLRVKSVVRLHGEGHLGVDFRQTPKISMAPTVSTGPIAWKLYPGNYYLMTTHEKVNMPDDLVGVVTPRTTMFRSGTHLLCSNVAPGYRGPLTFGLYVHLPMTLEDGARVAHIQFHQVSGNNFRSYTGQWQGGRMVVPGGERQV